MTTFKLKFRKLPFTWLLSVAIVTVAICGGDSPSARASDAELPTFRGFINGPMILSQGLTNYWGQTNTWMEGPLTTTNNPTTGNNTAPGIPVPGVTLYNIGTNAAAPWYHTNISAIVDVPLWANRDGSTPNATLAGVVCGFVGGVNGSNTLTFRFASVIRGIPFNMNSTATQNTTNYTWSYTMTATGPTTAFAIPIPGTFLANAHNVRCTAIESAGANGGTNCVLYALDLMGFTP